MKTTKNRDEIQVHLTGPVLHLDILLLPNMNRLQTEG